MSNLPQSIKSQLKGLKDLSLTDAEKLQQKNMLMAEIGVQESQVKKEFIAKEVFSVFVKDLTSTMTWQSIGAMFLLFGVVIGPGAATVSASRGSLPGDTLYPVKRNLEKARVSMRFSDKGKVELEINHVENRVNELARLTKEQAPSPERTVKVFLALEELKKDTASVKGRIEKIKDDSKKDTSADKKKKKDAAKVALLVQEKTVDVQESIKTTAKDLASEGDKEAHADVKEALDSVNEVAIDALEVIVETHEEDEDVVNEEEVKELVKKQLENTKEIVEVLKEEVSDEEATEESSDEEGEETQNFASEQDEIEETTEEPVEEEAAEEEASEESTEEETTEEESSSEEEEATDEEVKEEVKKIIEEDLSEEIEIIEQLIEMDNLSQAVEKLADTKEQVSELNKELRVQVDKEVQEEQQEEQAEEAEPEESEEPEESTVETEEQDEPAEEETEEKPLIDDVILE